MEYTTEEIRDQFLDHVRSLIEYWDKVDKQTTKEKLSGLAFSLLVTIDGDSALPGFILAPCPHENDKQYHIDNNEKYYPENHETNVRGDISGFLHESLYQK